MRRTATFTSVPAGILLTALGGIAIGACGTPAGGRAAAPPAPRIAHWSEFARVRRPLDLAGPRRDGSLVAANDARLSLLTSNGHVVPFASGPGGYRSPGGEEPYIALSPGGAYGAGTVYALRLTGDRGVVAISARGRARRFASLTAPGLIE